MREEIDAAARAEAALIAAAEEVDPRGPLAATLLLAADRAGAPIDPRRVLEFWKSRSPGNVVSEGRYRWELRHERAPGASYCPPLSEWVAWREGDARVLARDAGELEQRLTVPISMADGCELLARVAIGAGDLAELAAELLDEAELVMRVDLAAHVRAGHAWADTFALRCISARPRTLERTLPFALAISACYTALARRAGGRVEGIRFPFHARPLVSASAHLASGLLALGQDLKLLASLIAFVTGERGASGGWGDDGGAEDLLTTVVAADLLIHVDPAFDATSTTRFFLERQSPDGFFRAMGPEIPWLTDAIASYLRDVTRPFASRFRWPHLPDANRDSKTQLPFYAYFADLQRLFAGIPGLSSVTCPVAFIDLAGFRAFNNKHGQDMGDAVLRAFADELATIDDAVAIRDGGDEFLVLGAPTAATLSASIDAFRARWPERFIERFGADAPPVVARILVGETRGDALGRAREVLGRSLGEMKHVDATGERLGVRRDVGRIE